VDSLRAGLLDESGSIEYLRLMEHTAFTAMNTTQVYAVIGGADYEGEDFDTLRLFDSKEMAEAYAESLDHELCIDYVLTKVKNVEARV